MSDYTIVSEHADAILAAIDDRIANVTETLRPPEPDTKDVTLRVTILPAMKAGRGAQSWADAVCNELEAAFDEATFSVTVEVVGDE